MEKFRETMKRVRCGPCAGAWARPLGSLRPSKEEDLSVFKTIVASSVLAAGLLVSGANQPANAVWVCGPVQGVWDPTPAVGYVVPSYAAGWAAPLYPGCVWKRGLLGRWRMICP